MNARIPNNDKLDISHALYGIDGYIPDSSFSKDLDNVGNYWGNISNTWSNCPAHWGTLVSFKSSGKQIQLFYSWNEAKIYVRAKNNGWTAWKALVSLT